MSETSKDITAFVVYVVLAIFGCLVLAFVVADIFQSRSIKKAARGEDYLPVGFEIVSYHGHEYISRHKGGIVHSESCKCRESERAK